MAAEWKIWKLLISGRGLKDHLFPAPQPWAGASSTRPGCSKPSGEAFSRVIHQLGMVFPFPIPWRGGMGEYLDIFLIFNHTYSVIRTFCFWIFFFYFNYYNHLCFLPSPRLYWILYPHGLGENSWGLEPIPLVLLTPPIPGYSVMEAKHDITSLLENCDVTSQLFQEFSSSGIQKSNFQSSYFSHIWNLNQLKSNFQLAIVDLHVFLPGIALQGCLCGHFFPGALDLLPEN